MTSLNWPVTPTPVSWDTGWLLGTVLLGSDTLFYVIHLHSSVTKAGCTVAAYFLVRSCSQSHLHAYSKDFNHVGNKDSPMIPGINQGNGHPSVPPSTKIDRMLGPRNGSLQLRENDFRYHFTIHVRRNEHECND